MLGTLSGSDWAVLIPLLATSFTTMVVAVINALQNGAHGRTLASVESAVNGQAHLLASNNAATVAALTSAIETQATAVGNPPPPS